MQTKNETRFLSQKTMATAILMATVLTIFAFFYLFSSHDGMSNQVGGTHSAGMVHTEGMTHQGATDERQAEVAEVGHQVMPFDLERTTHIFETTEDGGVQQVISDDGDPEQISLIRTHLQEELGRFQQGDFADPAFIHGSDMPGLQTLQEGYDQITINYTELENGGQITYITTDPQLIEAIHAWFAAQLSDHGNHATDTR